MWVLPAVYHFIFTNTRPREFSLSLLYRWGNWGLAESWPKNHIVSDNTQSYLFHSSKLVSKQSNKVFFRQQKSSFQHHSLRLWVENLQPVFLLRQTGNEPFPSLSRTPNSQHPNNLQRNVTGPDNALVPALQLGKKFCCKGGCVWKLSKVPASILVLGSTSGRPGLGLDLGSGWPCLKGGITWETGLCIPPSG